MNDLEEHLTKALGRRGADVNVDDRLESFGATNESVRHQADERTRFQPRFLAAAAAACLVVVGVLAVAQLNEQEIAGPATTPDSGEPTQPESSPGRALSSVDALGADDWVVPTVLPNGFEFQYAQERGSGGRYVQVGASQPEEDFFSVGVSKFPGATTGDALAVDGKDWHVQLFDKTVIAELRIGTLVVGVGGVFADDDELVAVLAGLRVVDAGELASMPVEYGTEMTEVAVFSNENGEFVLSIDESDGWYCTRLSSESGSRGFCATFFDAANHLQAQHGTSNSFGGITRDSVPYVEGRASAETAVVEVEWRDGAVSSVEPQNTSNRFPGVKFWATDMSVELDPNREPGDVLEVRAFAADGSLLATSRNGRVVVEP